MRYVLMAFLLYWGGATARAEAPVVQAVQVTVRLAEQDLQRVREKVGAPVMEMLKALPGTAGISSWMTHAYLRAEIGFKGGASEDDRTSVEAALERLALEREVEVVSVTVELVPAVR